MSRQRAVIGGGYRPSKRDLEAREHQRFRDLRRKGEQPEAKPTLAERVLPWRRRRAKRLRDQEQGIAAAAANYETQVANWRKWRREQRRRWRGTKSTHKQRVRMLNGVQRDLKRLIDAGEMPRYDHPQARRIARLIRQGRTDDARELAARYGLHGVVPSGPRPRFQEATRAD